jgi:hypothetical protein
MTRLIRPWMRPLKAAERTAKLGDQAISHGL